MTFDEYRKWVDSFRKNIVCFKDDGWEYVGDHFSPPEGLYLTMRLGYAGIYTVLDSFKNGKWGLCVLDSSRIIAYKPTPIKQPEVEKPIIKTPTPEEIINYWKNRKPFSEAPWCDIPNYKDKDWYRREIVPLIIALGAIPKDQLKKDQWYKGACRNSSKAKWDGEKFVYERYKWGSTYWDDIDHFDSDTCYDVFIPFEEIEE